MKQSAKYGVIIALTVGCIAIGTGIGVGIGVGLKLQKDHMQTNEEQVVTSDAVESNKQKEEELPPSDNPKGEVQETVIDNGLGAYQDRFIFAADLEAKYNDGQSDNERSLEQSRKEEKDNYLNDPQSYLIPNSDTDKLSTYDYSFLDNEQCDLARNEIYARHGYIFKKDEYKKAFGAKSWYQPTISDINQIKLSEAENFNVKCLKWWAEVNHDIDYMPSDKGFTDCYEFDLGEHFNIDLNSDGTLDEIVFKQGKVEDDWGEVWIEINGEKSEIINGFFEPKIWVVDVAHEDPYLELVIYDMGPSSDPVDYYYTYDGKQIIYMGAVSGHLNGEDYIKDAMLYSVTRSDILGTRYYREKNILTSDHTWEVVPCEMVDVNIPLFTMNDINIYSSKDMGSSTKVCKMGTALTAIQTDLEEWVKVKLEDGSEGWIQYDATYDLAGLLYCD